MPRRLCTFGINIPGPLIIFIVFSDRERGRGISGGYYGHCVARVNRRGHIYSVCYCHEKKLFFFSKYLLRKVEQSDKWLLESWHPVTQLGKRLSLVENLSFWKVFLSRLFLPGENNLFQKSFQSCQINQKFVRTIFSSPRPHKTLIRIWLFFRKNIIMRASVQLI